MVAKRDNYYNGHEKKNSISEKKTKSHPQIKTANRESKSERSVNNKSLEHWTSNSGNWILKYRGFIDQSIA